MGYGTSTGRLLVAGQVTQQHHGRSCRGGCETQQEEPCWQSSQGSEQEFRVWGCWLFLSISKLFFVAVQPLANKVAGCPLAPAPFSQVPESPKPVRVSVPKQTIHAYTHPVLYLMFGNHGSCENRVLDIEGAWARLKTPSLGNW